MNYDNLKKINIPIGLDTVLYDVITKDGNRYLVASKSPDGVRKKIIRYEGKNANIVSLIEVKRGIL